MPVLHALCCDWIQICIISTGYSQFKIIYGYKPFFIFASHSAASIDIQSGFAMKSIQLFIFLPLLLHSVGPFIETFLMTLITLLEINDFVLPACVNWWNCWHRKYHFSKHYMNKTKTEFIAKYDRTRKKRIWIDWRLLLCEMYNVEWNLISNEQKKKQKKYTNSHSHMELCAGISSSLIWCSTFNCILMAINQLRKTIIIQNKMCFVYGVVIISLYSVDPHIATWSFKTCTLTTATATHQLQLQLQQYIVVTSVHYAHRQCHWRVRSCVHEFFPCNNNKIKLNVSECVCVRINE